MSVLGNGLSDAEYDTDAMSVKEATLAMLRRAGAAEDAILATQSNLSNTYAKMERVDQALQMDREIYSGRLKLHGKENDKTLRAASNYASTLVHLNRFEEAKSLLRKTIPVARRVLGESHETTFKTGWIYAQSLYNDDSATLDDLREAVTTLEEIERIARRVFGGAHPSTTGIETSLRMAREKLRARETPSTRA